MKRTILISALLALSPLAAFAGCPAKHDQQVKIICPAGMELGVKGQCVKSNLG